MSRTSIQSSSRPSPSRPRRGRRLLVGALGAAAFASALVGLNTGSGHAAAATGHGAGGITCVIGAPYIDGGGPRPGYFFDTHCDPVSPWV